MFLLLNAVDALMIALAMGTVRFLLLSFRALKSSTPSHHVCARRGGLGRAVRVPILALVIALVTAHVLMELVTATQKRKLISN